MINPAGCGANALLLRGPWLSYALMIGGRRGYLKKRGQVTDAVGGESAWHVQPFGVF